MTRQAGRRSPTQRPGGCLLSLAPLHVEWDLVLMPDYAMRNFGEWDLLLLVGIPLLGGMFFVLLWWLTSKIGR